ncbi:hypothetical protein NHJ6243_010107 [Beauveria neobassiana]
MKVKPNGVHLENLSPTRSQLSDLSRLTQANLFFQPSIDRREHSLERRGINYHGSEDEMKGTISLKRPHIDEDYSRAGHKHGTHSLPAKYAEHDPLGQAMPGRSGYAATRSSPTFRMPTILQGSSISAASMATTSRPNSYMSALLVPPSESSADFYSHSASTDLSINQIFPPAACSPFATRQLFDPSPRVSVSRGLVESRGSSGSRPGKIVEACKCSRV